MQLKMAFEGGAARLRFVSSRPAGLQMGGLSLVSLEVEEDRERRTRDLVMYRAMPDDDAKDFGPLDKGERHIVVPGVDRVVFDYFGSENEFAEPSWHDAWDYPARMPEMVRVRLRSVDGSEMPELIVRIELGEEAGCPRRPT
jgi:hypothetical protein